MMIRALKILVLFAAGLLYTIHGVVYHHHHNGQVCFVSDHCTTENHETTDSGDHSHDNNKDGICILNQEMFPPPQQFRSVPEGGDDLPFNDRFFLTDNAFPAHPALIFLPDIPLIPGFEGHLQIPAPFGSSLNGLRAPPQS